ncbi:hypothetical protein C0J52_16480 [Blattella germanica]|nr:hypothetical protein C0J52_16480 [Blattella germanica]
MNGKLVIFFYFEYDLENALVDFALISLEASTGDEQMLPLHLGADWKMQLHEAHIMIPLPPSTFTGLYPFQRTNFVE